MNNMCVPQIKLAVICLSVKNPINYPAAPCVEVCFSPMFVMRRKSK